MRLSELATAIGAELAAQAASDGDRPIDGVQTVENAGPREITFLTNPRFKDKLGASRAAAVIVGERVEGLAIPQLLHKNPYAAMAKASQLFYRYEHAFQGQSELAFVHPEAKVDGTATLYPFCYVDRGAEVAAGAVIYPQCYVGVSAKVGPRSVLFPGVTVMERCEVGPDNILHPGAVLGGDGFGFAPTREGLEKIPQIAGVKLEADVEVGSNTTVDRGAFDDTRLSKGVKLDSLVQIGHGSVLGEYSMICGLAGVAGSVKTGKRYIGAGHSGVAPGIVVPDNVVLGAMGGLVTTPEKPGEYLGMPAVPAGEWRRKVVSYAKLPDLVKTVRELEARLAKLEGKAEG